MTLIDRPRMQVLAGARDITDRCDSITFSAVDRGGYEIATLGQPAADRPTKGTRVTIRQGLEVAWDGRVAEVADHSIHGRATKTTGCEGYQALLKDNPMQMIYVDRDLGQWHGMSVARRIALTPTYSITDGQPTPDESGAPSVITSVSGPTSAPILAISEGWYDAGPGNLIGSLYYAWKRNANIGAGAPWSYRAALATGDQKQEPVEGPQLRGEAASSGTGTVEGTGLQRYALLQLAIEEAIASQGKEFDIYWQPAVYGNHGLTKRGEDPGGFYPSDIARHALSKVAGISVGVITDSTSYIAPHVVYRTPTDPADVINDMAKLMGWTWGVWEPATILGREPRLDFRPPPTDATCVISKAECDELDITSRLGDLYDVAIVSYTDEAGTSGEVTVTLSNPQLYEALGASHGRTLKLDAGLSSEEAARALGLFALQLSQVASRGAGQATLPVAVRLANGASKPSALLRPGIDRVRITDLVDGGPMLEQGTGRRDVFRISRVETTVSKDGAPNTRVELDQGTNLLETLQARLALAAGVVGSGAVG